MTPTGWSGTITSHIAGNYWLSNNLKVDHEEVRKGKKITSGGGTEDVSVTVTNTTATSAPVTTTAVPTVPDGPRPTGKAQAAGRRGGYTGNAVPHSDSR